MNSDSIVSTKDILVSVVIPIYNCEKYVKKAIDSVLAQTHINLEIIVVDDGSLDGSREIVNRIKDNRLRVVERKNGGLAAARNTGIKESKGQLIGLLDADDWWHPKKIEFHVKHFMSNPNLGLSFSYSELVDESGHSLSILQMGQTTNITSKNIYLKNPIGNGSAVVINKNLIADASKYKEDKDKSALFNENLRQSEDVECWLRICLTTSWSLEGIPFVLTYYRINQSSLSANLEKQYQSWKETSSIISKYDKEFIDKYQATAEAFYLRYLARRAQSQRNTKEAWKYLKRSLKRYPLIVIMDPLRTTVTFAAIAFLTILPRRVYSKLERLAMINAGRSQKRRAKQRQTTLIKRNK